MKNNLNILNNKSRYLNYVNNFRAIAIICIIIGHSFVNTFINWENNELAYKTACVLFRNGTVFFVFISGFLFQHLSNKYNYLNFLIKKFKYVILPYLIIAIPSIPYFLTINKGQATYTSFFTKPLLIQISQLYLTGDSLLPFWFIPMITLFFIISPILIAIDRTPKLYKYIIPVSIIISMFIRKGPDLDPILGFVHYFSIYLIGMCSCKYKDLVTKYAAKYYVYFIFISLLFAFAQMTFFDIVITKFGSNDPLSYFSKLFGCYAWIGFLIRFDDFFGKKLDLLAKSSFGLYFIHGYFIILFDDINKHLLNQICFNSNLFNILIFPLIIILFSLISTQLIQKIFKDKSRYIIGC